MILGTWVPALNIFETSLRRGKFDDSRVLSDGSLMEFAAVLPMDAVFDSPEDVPEEIKTNKRYAANEGCVAVAVAVGSHIPLDAQCLALSSLGTPRL